MRIEGLRKFRGRNPNGYFEDLPWEVRQRAQMWLHRFCKRWGRKMLAKRGGYAVQRQYQAEGRVSTRHPAHHAARVGASKRRWKTTVKERQQQDIKPRSHGFTNMAGI